MSLTHDCLSAFAAGAAVCCAVYGAFAASGEAHVDIDNFTYNPGTITVRAGTEVEWVNDDDIPHTVAATNGEFHSRQLEREDKFRFIFTQPGTYEYFCSVHPRMVAKVVVTP